jgi:hypothetical protein
MNKAENMPNTRASWSDGTARWSAVTASTSTTSVDAPRTIWTANASSGLWITVNRAVGRQ